MRKNIFKPSKIFSKNNGEISIDNPFYDKILTLSKSCRNWQLAFLIMACLVCITLGSYINLANKSKLVPYIVEIDKEKNVTFLGKMEQITYRNNDPVIFATLNNFVINTRSISLDKVFTFKKFKREYSFLGKEMKSKMNTDIQNINLNKKFKDKETIDVQITSMLKNSDNIYQLHWTEKYYINGGYSSTKKWTGTFSIIEDRNLSEEDMLINPLGIIIQDYHISRDLSM